MKKYTRMWRIHNAHNNYAKWNNNDDLSIHCRSTNIVLYSLFLDCWVLREIQEHTSKKVESTIYSSNLHVKKTEMGQRNVLYDKYIVYTDGA